MLEVVPLVRRLLPDLLRTDRPSVACVSTTRPKYLVFDGDAARPACVIEFGDADRLIRVERILLELHRRVPDVVSQSLCCTTWRNGTYVQIQEGLPGTPWFRVSDGLATPAAWRAVLDRAVSVMGRLHAAIGDVPIWNGAVSVRAELASQVRLCMEHGTVLSQEVLRRIHEWSGRFESAGALASVWQHGDFSLNNLLVSPDSLAVIDFDEFGGTLVPLHDGFGLALSFPLSQGTRCPLSLAQCLGICVEQSLRAGAIAAGHLPGLLMHHLLWRINQCHGLERRAALRRILLGWVEDLSADPGAFLGPVAR